MYGLRPIPVRLGQLPRQLPLKQIARQFTTTKMKQIQVFRSIDAIRHWRKDQMIHSKAVGLVPTMGALHKGHISLVKESLNMNDSTVVSIFVNPSQFAPHEDLDQYPRTMESDLKSLESLGSSNIVVFAPTVDEMYPTGVSLQVEQQTGAFVEVKGLSEQLEGGARPHFFRGVATIVTKLLNVVTPENAYFGQKDVQQTVVVTRLVKDLLLPTKINVLPTIRESNGLAMSSRNTYLTSESFDNASVMYKALREVENLFHSVKGPISAKILSDRYYEVLNTQSFESEYFSISHKESLEDLDTVTQEGAIVSCAIKVPNKQGTSTRIIDNIIL